MELAGGYKPKPKPKPAVHKDQFEVKDELVVPGKDKEYVKPTPSGRYNNKAEPKLPSNSNYS